MMATSVIRWEEPPPRSPMGRRDGKRNGAHSRYWPLAEELRRKPGEWAVVYEGDGESVSQTALGIRRGLPSPFLPAGAFEATGRSVGEGVQRLYVRYVGGEAR